MIFWKGINPFLGGFPSKNSLNFIWVGFACDFGVWYRASPLKPTQRVKSLMTPDDLDPFPQPQITCKTLHLFWDFMGSWYAKSWTLNPWLSPLKHPHLAAPSLPCSWGVTKATALAPTVLNLLARSLAHMVKESCMGSEFCSGSEISVSLKSHGDFLFAWLKQFARIEPKISGSFIHDFSDQLGSWE